MMQKKSNSRFVPKIGRADNFLVTQDEQKFFLRDPKEVYNVATTNLVFGSLCVPLLLCGIKIEKKIRKSYSI